MMHHCESWTRTVSSWRGSAISSDAAWQLPIGLVVAVWNTSTPARRGGKIITSRQAVERYLAKLNGIDLDAPEAVEATPVRSKARQKELARVDAALAAAGI